MFQDAEHKLTSSTELSTMLIRVGQIAGSTLCWREDNFKPKKVSGKETSLRALFPPNVGYARVPQARRAEFNRALDSFVREIERTPDQQDAQRLFFAALVSNVEPVYPAVAQKNKIQGAVWLDTVVGKDGHVASAQSISGNPVLVGAAKDAVLQWVYKPTLLNGEPIEVIMKVCVPFVLRQSKQTPSPCAPPTGRVH
jgi:TonB family protein